MPKILVGDIQGPQGETGDPGPPGATGVNSIFDGTSYVDQDGAKNFIGNTDPGAVPNGSVWFDTS